METWIIIILAICTMFVNVSGSCDSIDVNVDNIQNVQLNTTVHPPLATTVDTSIVQCVQRCFHLATCNKINFAQSLQTCRYFDISGPETTVASPTWKSLALSDVAWPTAPYICSSHTCVVGQVCFDYGTGPVCTDLIH